MGEESESPDAVASQHTHINTHMRFASKYRQTYVERIAVHRHEERLVQVLADHARDLLDLAKVNDVAVRAHGARDRDGQAVVVPMEFFPKALESQPVAYTHT